MLGQRDVHNNGPEGLARDRKGQENVQEDF
jgi:hypothetical protein